MGKKFFYVWIALIFVLSAVCAAYAQETENPSVPENYRGVWSSGRAEIRMIRAGMGYKALIHWGGSAWESYSWQYTLLYDAENDCLTDSGTGIKSLTVFSQDGSESSYTEIYTDGAAVFRLNEAGKLLWEDGMEDAGKGMEFEKSEYEGNFPTREELAEGFFKVIGGYHQGTAGSSLAAARAAYQAYDFAQNHMIWNEDTAVLRSDLLAVWESMTQKEQQAFDANFIPTLRLVSDCLDDWDGNQGVFSDAGVDVSRMGTLLKDISAQESWSRLTANTLTMGNSED